MAVFYNEFDPDAAQWLRNLIASGHLPDGEVDTRSIEDVQPEDLRGFTQHHFFAGVGGWPLALRLAGWPDDRPAWTGSPPCQPFSVAGKQLGADDPRHLWPHFFRLLRACRPPVLFGEQVSAAIGKHWLDGVFADLEGEGYACRSFVVPACSVNAPHRRDRLWLIAERGGAVGDRERARLEGHAGDGRNETGRPIEDRPVASSGSDSDVAGVWGGAEWVIGHDGKARRVEPGIRLLVDGISAWVAGGSASSETTSRQVALKGFGNAIVPEVAVELVLAYLEWKRFGGREFDRLIEELVG